MATVVLVTGGSRSGKSRHARELAEKAGTDRTFVATCPHLDAEMEVRIQHHQQERQGKGWRTVEEPVHLEEALSRIRADVLLVDCLTLWIGNLLFEAEEQGREVDEQEVERRCEKLLEICRWRQGTVVFVTNEVGMGIVPEHALGRLFRDLTGRCNQVIARGADQVVFMVSGLPLVLK